MVWPKNSATLFETFHPSAPMATSTTPSFPLFLLSFSFFFSPFLTLTFANEPKTVSGKLTRAHVALASSSARKKSGQRAKERYGKRRKKKRKKKKRQVARRNEN